MARVRSRVGLDELRVGEGDLREERYTDDYERSDRKPPRLAQE